MRQVVQAAATISCRCRFRQKISIVDRGTGDVEDQLADLWPSAASGRSGRIRCRRGDRAATQGVDFEDQFALFQRPADDVDQIAGRERFLHEIVVAPLRIASTASVTSPWPVMMMTGKSASRWTTGARAPCRRRRAGACR